MNLPIICSSPLRSNLHTAARRTCIWHHRPKQTVQMSDPAIQPGIHAGTKRSRTSTSDVPDVNKRQKIRHRIRRAQIQPLHTEAASQDPVFAQGQLLRSISAALVLAGFDGVKPTALEMFRSHVEECEQLLRITSSSQAC